MPDFSKKLGILAFGVNNFIKIGILDVNKIAVINRIDKASMSISNLVQLDNDLKLTWIDSD